MANVWSPLVPLRGEVEIYIPKVFCRKFNFGQLLFDALFDTIGTFDRNQIKFSTNFETPYFGSKKPYVWGNSYALEKSVYVRIVELW